MANPNTAVFPLASATDADLVPVTDAYVTSLVGSIDSTQDSLTVASIYNAYGNAVNMPIVLTIDGEQIYAPTRAGGTFSSCVRGINGTTAAGHASEAPVRGNLVADVINQLSAEVKALEDYLATLSLPSTGAQLFSVGNIEVPANTTVGMFTVVGGGGGGAGANNSGGGAGAGAGEVRQIYLTGLTPGETITVVYGAGGPGGAAGNAGTDGGDTSISGAGISGTITARGGRGAPDPDVSRDGGDGGAWQAHGAEQVAWVEAKENGLCGGGGFGSATITQDSVAGAGMNTRGGNVTGGPGIYRGGGGGGCPWGIPGTPSTQAIGASSNMDALPGSGFGAGGAGGSRDNSYNRNGAGSAGRPGCVVVQWN